MTATFSQDVKSEILKNSNGVPPCCELAFLAGFIRTSGSVTLSPSGLGFSLAAENLNILKRINTITQKLYGITAEIVEEQVYGLNRTKFVLNVKDGEKILVDCGIVGFDERGLRQIKDGFDRYLLEENCCKKTFIKAVFLGAGYVTLPEEKNKDGYHLEFALSNTEFEEVFAEFLAEFEFAPKKVLRKNETVLYFKGSEQISDILAFLGAAKSVFRLQNTIAERSIRNRANRQTNCISANIDKTVEAAEKQLHSINVIEQTMGLEKLPAVLFSAAKLRRDNPSESLDELAALSNVTKSGLNHRFRRINEIAKKIGKQEVDL